MKTMKPMMTPKGVKTEQTLMVVLFAVCAVLVVGLFVVMLTAGVEPVRLADATARYLPGTLPLIH